MSAALWDDEDHSLIGRPVQLARDAGELGRRPMLLNQLASAAVWRGDFAAAASLIAEADAVCEATGARIALYAALRLAGFRGREADGAPLIQDTIERAAAVGLSSPEIGARLFLSPRTVSRSETRSPAVSWVLLWISSVAGTISRCCCRWSTAW